MFEGVEKEWGVYLHGLHVIIAAPTVLALLLARLCLRLHLRRHLFKQTSEGTGVRFRSVGVEGNALC